MNSRISVIGILKKCLDLGFPGNFQRSIRAIPLHFPTIPVNLNIQSPDSVQSTSNDRFLKSQETFQFTSCFKHTFLYQTNLVTIQFQSLIYKEWILTEKFNLFYINFGSILKKYTLLVRKFSDRQTNNDYVL